MHFLKHVLFALAPLVFLAIAIESVLALAGVDPFDTTQDPYVGFASALPVFEAERDAQGNTVWRTAHNKLRFFNPQSFAVRKTAGTKRIFCLGGSTTYGRPHHDRTSFCGWLREYLITIAPEGQWEVVNAGGISYASYRVAEVARELAHREPDLFIVYTGHNEFLEDRTYGSLRERPAWLRQVDVVLRGTRTYSGLTRVLRPEPERLAAEVSTLLDQSIGPDAYHRDDGWKNAVIAHYRMNLERIVSISREAGAELMLVVPADNLRDCTPFKSESDAALPDADLARFQSLLERAREMGDPEEASRFLEEAVALDPRHAHARFHLGRALQALGKSDAAEREFVRARDEDVCPLRALSPILELVREVAQREKVPLIDYPALIASASGPGALPRGADWFLDHVHPTIEGHGFLARAILSEIARLGWIVEDFGRAETAMSAVRGYVMKSIDDRERGLSMRNLAKVLSWAGKSEDAARAARQALEWLGPDAECLFILSLAASDLGDHLRAVTLLREALRLDPDWVKARHNLGVELARSGRNAEAIAAYDAVIAIAPDHESVHFNRANALVRLGRNGEAIADYQTALTRNPEDDDARHNLASLMQRPGLQTHRESPR